MSELRHRLQVGERIPMREFRGALARAIAVTILAALFAAVFPFSGLWIGSHDPSPPTQALHVLVVLIWAAVLAMAVCRSVVAWGTYLHCAVRFSATGIDFRDWRGRLHRIEIKDVIALYRLRPRWPLSLCWVPGAGGTPRWTSLAGLGSGLGEATGDEIIDRCKLIEGFGGVWQQTADAVLPPRPWWWH